MIYLYFLKQDGIVKYVGLTNDPSQRKRSHFRNKPPHEFEVILEFSDVGLATEAERTHIKEHNTMQEGWNISPGGEYAKASGYCRKGIGGQKKGCLTWNKGKPGCFSKASIEKMRRTRKGKCYAPVKISKDQQTALVDLYKSTPPVPGVGVKSKNGRYMSYAMAFAKFYAPQYGVTPQNIMRIVKLYV
jgi:hypothetical protein